MMNNTNLQKIGYYAVLTFSSLIGLAFLNPAHAAGAAVLFYFVIIGFLIVIPVLSAIMAGIMTAVRSKKITGSKFTYFIKEFFITAGIIIAICISLPLAISLFYRIASFI